MSHARFSLKIAMKLWFAISAVIFLLTAGQVSGDCLVPDASGANVIQVYPLSSKIFYTAGDQIIYSCFTPGYDLVFGSLTIMCMPGATIYDSDYWSGAVPHCQVVDCGDPGLGLFTNRSMSATTYLSQATYTCESALYEFQPPVGLTQAQEDLYVQTTSITLTCQANKEWSAPLPSCRRKLCGAAPLVTGATVAISGDQFGDSAIYSAVPGYRISGTAVLTCSAKKTWQPSSVTASAVNCPLPDLIANTEWTKNATATLSSSCNVATNGEIVCPYGIVIELTCTDGYENIISGDQQRSCQDDGTWSGSALTCQGMTCPPLSKSNPSLILDQPTNNVGDGAVYQCPRGYYFSGIGDLTRVCQSDGTWSGVEPICTPINCVNVTFEPMPNSTAIFIFSKRAPQHYETLYSIGNELDEPLITVENATYGSQIAFSCVNGSRWARGSRLWSCKSDGTWDSVTPIVCKPDIPPPGINTLPPDLRKEAENADSVGRLIFTGLGVSVAAIALADVIGMIRHMRFRLKKLHRWSRLAEMRTPSLPLDTQPQHSQHAEGI